MDNEDPWSEAFGNSTTKVGGHSEETSGGSSTKTSALNRGEETSNDSGTTSGEPDHHGKETPEGSETTIGGPVHGSGEETSKDFQTSFGGRGRGRGGETSFDSGFTSGGRGRGRGGEGFGDSGFTSSGRGRGGEGFGDSGFSSGGRGHSRGGETSFDSGFTSGGRGHGRGGETSFDSGFTSGGRGRSRGGEGFGNSGFSSGGRGHSRGGETSFDTGFISGGRGRGRGGERFGDSGFSSGGRGRGGEGFGDSGFSSGGRGRGGGGETFGDNRASSFGGRGRGSFGDNGFGENTGRSRGRGGGSFGVNDSGFTGRGRGNTSEFGIASGRGRNDEPFADNDGSVVRGRGSRGGLFRGRSDDTYTSGFESQRGRGGFGTFGGQQVGTGDDNAINRIHVEYVPEVRSVDEILKDDENNATVYANVCQDDEDLVVEGLTGAPSRLDKWEEAGFPEELLSNIKKAKYCKPRKIQSAAIGLISDGYDIKGHAETGSGKTAAYLLPIIAEIIINKKQNKWSSEIASPFAIIIGPTRELVLQVYEQVTKFIVNTGVTVAKAYGQYSTGKNVREIHDGCDILCATPGRLKHFVNNGEIRCNNVNFLVLDEADNLMESVFSDDIRSIISVEGFPSKENRQVLLFSATFPPGVHDFANELLRSENCAFISIKKNSTNKRIKQDFIIVPENEKLEKLHNLLKAEAENGSGDSNNVRRTLVFVSTKKKSDVVALYLSTLNIPAQSINGDREQKLREKAINDFRRKIVSILVATDVCARGIDIQDLDHVVNFDLPTEVITYIHRVGRVGRLRPGFATSFVDPDGNDLELLKGVIESFRANGQEIPQELTDVLEKSNPFGQGIPTNADTGSFGPQTYIGNDFGSLKGIESSKETGQKVSQERINVLRQSGLFGQGIRTNPDPVSSIVDQETFSANDLQVSEDVKSSRENGQETSQPLTDVPKEETQTSTDPGSSTVDQETS